MLKNFKLFGLFNIIDLIIVLVLVFGVSILFLSKSDKYPKSAQVAQEMKLVEFDVLLKNEIITRQAPIFNAGDKTFLTIRNVPYTKLEIIKATRTSAKTNIPNPRNRAKVISVENPSAPYVYDFLVTLKDNAVVTGDGIVIGGNKIKIGLPITLEGVDYRLAGIVSDVRIQK